MYVNSPGGSVTAGNILFLFCICVWLICPFLDVLHNSFVEIPVYFLALINYRYGHI